MWTTAAMSSPILVCEKCSKLGAITCAHGQPDVPAPYVIPTRVKPNLPHDARLDDSLLRGYSLQGEIGSGATSTVYKGIQRESGKIVAVKVLSKSIAKNEAMIERFKKEAYISSQLFSPYTVWTLDYGLLLDGRPFMVMDFIEGKSAGDLVEEEGAVSLERALPIFFQIATGLADAHAHGIMHRDIKPDNVMLVEENDMRDWVKIIDFGIAKSYVGLSEPDAESTGEFAEESLGLTHSGVVIGSPLYMSPEQCLGSAIDHRTDVYSFGCFMYEMLTGYSVFEASSAENMLFKHIYEIPVAMSEKAPSLTLHSEELLSRVEQIVRRALAKDPDNRYQLASDIRIDLRACINLLPTSQPLPLD